MRNYSNENDFELHENETACRTHFHMQGFALRLDLKQTHKRTLKWPTDFVDVSRDPKTIDRDEIARPSD